MKKKLLYFAILLIVLLAAGCGDKAAAPVEINEETAVCEICNMAVADSEFATQILLENGKTLLFDDIGCMYGWLEENDSATEAIFVRDYENKNWIESNDATYVYDESVKTPMAYNVISFESKDKAEAYLESHHGTLLTHDDLHSHEWKMNKEMKENMKHSHGKTEGHGH